MNPAVKRRDLFAGFALPLAGFPASREGQESAAGAPPDLANLDQFVAQLAAENTPQLSFLNTRQRDLESWKREARAYFRRQLSYEPPRLALHAETVHREQRDGFQLEEVRIRATPGYDIPGWFLLPGRRSSRVPGIVAIHCHGGAYRWGHEKIVSHPDDTPALLRYRERFYGRPYAELLARRGFAVLVIDGFYFGRRRLQAETIPPSSGLSNAQPGLEALRKLEPESQEWLDSYHRVCREYENLTAKCIFAAGATWPGILAWDDQRSVDYLCSRPEVDPARIGAVGLSIGGLRTAHLIAADNRIKAACVVGWMPLFADLLRNHLRSHTWMAYVPGLYPMLDLPDAAALIAPGALLVQQCSHDILYPLPAMQGAVEKLRDIFKKAGISERFRGSFYDVPHAFLPDMQEEAFRWLEKWLVGR
jgi:dienelactone hydrolase